MLCLVPAELPHALLCHVHESSGIGLTAHADCCQLPVSGRLMQRFLEFRLGCRGLPVAGGRLAGVGHVDRAQWVCSFCNSGAVGDEIHLVLKRAALTVLWERYTGLFTSGTDTILSFLAQHDHYLVIDSLDLTNIS